MTTHRCETCDSPAEVEVVDLREMRPNDGSAFVRWERAGRHHYCRHHERSPQLIRLADRRLKLEGEPNE